MLIEQISWKLTKPYLGIIAYFGSTSRRACGSETNDLAISIARFSFDKDNGRKNCILFSWWSWKQTPIETKLFLLLFTSVDSRAPETKHLLKLSVWFILLFMSVDREQLKQRPIDLNSRGTCNTSRLVVKNSKKKPWNKQRNGFSWLEGWGKLT